GRLLRRVRDFAAVAGESEVDARIADQALNRLDVDGRGLDAMDRRYLGCIATHYSGGALGGEALARALSAHGGLSGGGGEPYLIQEGLLQRTPRGRMLTAGGFRYLGLPEPQRLPQLDLLSEAEDEG